MQTLLVGVGETVPEFLRGDDGHGGVDVVGQRDEFLYFLHLVGVHVDQRVFLTVDGLDFQRGEHFRESHRYGVGFEGLPGFQRDRVGHHANLESLDVFKFGHRVLAVGEVTEADAGVGQADEAGRLHLLEDFFHRRAVQHRIDFLGVGEQEGQIPDLDFLDAGRQRLQGAHVELLRAGLDGLQHLLVATEQSAVEDLDLHVVVGVLASEFGKLVHRRGLRMAFRHGVAQAGGDGRKGATDGQRAKRGSDGELLEDRSFHA